MQIRELPLEVREQIISDELASLSLEGKLKIYSKFFDISSQLERIVFERQNKKDYICNFQQAEEVFKRIEACLEVRYWLEFDPYAGKLTRKYTIRLVGYRSKMGNLSAK